MSSPLLPVAKRIIMSSGGASWAYRACLPRWIEDLGILGPYGARVEHHEPSGGIESLSSMPDQLDRGGILGWC